MEQSICPSGFKVLPLSTVALIVQEKNSVEDYYITLFLDVYYAVP